MASLKDNKPLLYSLLISGIAIIALTTGIVPEISQQFEIVEFSAEVSQVLNNFTIALTVVNFFSGNSKSDD